MPWETVREAPGKKADGLLSQVHFVAWIALGCAFVPSVLNVHIKFIRPVYSCWMSEHSYRIQSGYSTLHLDMVFCLAFMLPQIESMLCTKQLRLIWSVLRKFREGTALLIFSI